MKESQKDAVRKQFVEELFTLYESKGEDVGYIASNSFNFPIVTADGDECVIEVVVKIPKNDDDSLSKRTEYQLKCEERARKSKENAEKKAKKIADAKAKKEKEKGE